MAEILIAAGTSAHADPVKDRRGCYKRGDLVIAFEDGHEWGRLEVLPPAEGGSFVRLLLPGVTIAQINTFAMRRLGLRFERECTVHLGQNALLLNTANIQPGMELRALSSGVLPAPLVDTHDYLVSEVNAQGLRLSDGGDVVVFQDVGVGTHSLGLSYSLIGPEYTDTDLAHVSRLTRSRIRALIDNLPSGVRQQFNQQGYYSTTWSTIKGFLHDKQKDTVLD